MSTKPKTVKIDGRNIPCKDIVEIKPVSVSGTLCREITYDYYEPYYHKVKTTVPFKKGYEIELKVRKALR